MSSLDKKPKSRHATFSRRTLLLSGGMTAVFGVLSGRLYQLQIENGDLYLNRAEDNRINQRLLAPRRGRILDRFGVALASNRRNYRVLLVPERTRGGVVATLDALAKVIPINERLRAKALKDAATNKSFVPLVVAENLSWDDFARLNLDLPYLPGIQPDVGDTRDYPYTEELSHVLGYVAPVAVEDKSSAQDSASEDQLLDVPGGDTDLETRRRQAAGNRCADARAGPDDQCGAIGNGRHDQLLIRRRSAIVARRR